MVWAKQGGELSQAAMDALRRGWYLGEKTFRDRLLELLEKPAMRREPHRSGEAVRDRSQNEAERLIRLCAPAVGLAVETEALSALRNLLQPGASPQLAGLPISRGIRTLTQPQLTPESVSAISR